MSETYVDGSGAALNGICADRVVIVTGAGRGIGREHALELGRQGAKVVVNDIGGQLDGTGSSTAPADEVVNEIRSAGGQAVANSDDISDWNGAKHLIDSALDAFGDLHGLVNNAGILRDRMVVNMEEKEWDDVIRVHLKGAAGTMRWASGYWRTKAKAGETLDVRIVNTTSPSGIYGNVGQSNYGAAKAGVAALTIISSMELARYGITVNAVSPSARTRMTETFTASRTAALPGPDEFDRSHPGNIAPVVAWLCSPLSKGITGRVFNCWGGQISVAEAWHAGEEVDRQQRWSVEELTGVIPALVSKAQPNPDMFGQV